MNRTEKTALWFATLLTALVEQKRVADDTGGVGLLTAKGIEAAAVTLPEFTPTVTEVLAAAGGMEAALPLLKKRKDNR